jgi:carboxymethylenebutenolidase
MNPLKNIALGLLVIVFALASFAAEGKNVSYKSGGETVQGMLYTPPGKGPFPAIIVIHEYWGLNEWVKEQASKLSDQGYVALAVDLYRGTVADNPELAHQLMRGLPEDRANLATDSEALNKINAAILGIFGGNDQGIPPESVKMFEATLKQIGKRVEIKMYPDAGHGFENPNNKAGYRPDDAADAWKRTITFLADTLKK